jgi:hypothetical protein
MLLRLLTSVNAGVLAIHERTGTRGKVTATKMRYLPQQWGIQPIEGARNRFILSMQQQNLNG